MDFRRPPQGFRSGFGEAERSDLALGNKLGHGADGFLDGNIGINAMLIIEIDRFNAQSLKACVASTADILGRTINAADSVGTDAEAKLGGDDDAVARHFAQETAEQLLVLVWTVDFGGIKEVAAELQISAKHLEGFFFVGWSVGVGHSHAAEA